MLTKLIGRADAVAESSQEYNAAGEYEYRDAEYENEQAAEDEPKPSRATDPGLRGFTNGQSTFPAR